MTVNSKKIYKSIGTLERLRRKHPEWPHHDELLKLVTEASITELESSLRLRTLCKWLEQLSVEKKQGEKRSPKALPLPQRKTFPLFLNEPKKADGVHSIKTSPADWGSISPTDVANSKSLNRKANGSRRESLTVQPAMFYNRHCSHALMDDPRSCRCSKIKGKDKELFDRLRSLDKMVGERIVTPKLSGDNYQLSARKLDKLTTPAIKTVAKQTAAKMLYKPVCVRCVNSNRKRAGIKQIPYHTVKLTWRSCSKFPPITRTSLYNSLSQHGKIEELRMLSDSVAIAIFSQLNITLLSSTIDINGQKIKSMFYHNLYRKDIQMEKCGCLVLTEKQGLSQPTPAVGETLLPRLLTL